MRGKSVGRLACGCAAAAVILVTVLHGQGAIFGYPELHSGAWETTTASGGVHGVWLETHTDQRVKNRERHQALLITFYHRQNGKEVPEPRAESGGLQGNCLRSRGIDLCFDVGARQWKGSWFLEGEQQTVVLDRPACPLSPLCGTWEGRDPIGSVRVHLAESSDGVATGWLDRTSDPTNQRHGERLRIVSADSSNVRFETISAGCCSNQFSGRLSDDEMTITGKWSSPTINVDKEQVFRRLLAFPKKSTF